MKEDIIEVLYTVVFALACPFVLLIQPPSFLKEGEDSADT